jgi:glycosyltransferase involved in cell wall biosynthesis
MSRKMKPFFSIVIPTLNEETTLPKLLKNLSDQIWRDFEVIHIDGHSDDKTVARAKKFTSILDMKTVYCDVRNVSAQRNLGGEKARGEWILFIDADVQLESDFLLALRYKIALAAKKTKRVDVLSSLISLNAHDHAKAKHRAAVNVSNAYLAASASTDAPRLFGAFIGIRRSWFKKVKFDPEVKFMEDVDFVKRVIAAGGEYRLLRKPTFAYDMRRWDAHSPLYTLLFATKTQIQSLAHKDFRDFTEDDYDMSADRHATAEPKKPHRRSTTKNK